MKMKNNSFHSTHFTRFDSAVGLLLPDDNIIIRQTKLEIKTERKSTSRVKAKYVCDAVCIC
jgi:hypothetical protein